VATPKVLSHDIGDFIRDLRQNARISLRQLAEQAGVSNPYLSQIERGLRKPSAEVLQQLATALRVSTPVMYLRAGLLDLKDGQGVLAAIANDTDLTEVQKQTLTQIYETFRRENARDADAPAPPAATATSRRPSRPTNGSAMPSPAPTNAAPTTAVPTTAVPTRAAATKTAPTRTARSKTASANKASTEDRLNEDHQGRDRD
jgi:transcriptional regulator with XRE-family HTH domain